jgi:hypothetical protein
MANVTHSEAGKRKSEPSDSKSRRKPGKKIRVNAVPTKPRQQASEESAVVDMAIKVIGNKSDAMDGHARARSRTRYAGLTSPKSKGRTSRYSSA